MISLIYSEVHSLFSIVLSIYSYIIPIEARSHILKSVFQNENETELILSLQLLEELEIVLQKPKKKSIKHRALVEARHLPVYFNLK